MTEAAQGSRQVATPHALETYAPLPRALREGIGLCLSGGGYRATLFHLGALQRLNELKILDQLRTVSSVSGGSITAAHVATVLLRLKAPISGLSRLEWRKHVAEPLEAFTRNDIRTGAVLKRLLPWNWLRDSTGVEALAMKYERLLTSERLAAIPVTPQFVLCATDIAFGVNWIFTKQRIGDYEAGFMATPESWPLGRAVAASSCFPPIFNPLPMKFSPSQLAGGRQPTGPVRDDCINGLRLSDGGVYDNLGLEPVWKDHKVVLVSDGGALFPLQGDRNLVWRLGRYVGIQDHQAHSLRTRWLVANFLSGEMSGTYWSVGGARESYELTGGYSKPFAESAIGGIRTDLDAFSEAESAVLQNHGYLLADAAVTRHVPDLIPGSPPPVEPPYPAWLPPAKSEDLIRKALKGSGTRRLLGRRSG